MEKAIKIAIENGFKNDEWWYEATNSRREENIKYLATKLETTLDPLFWKSLGKGLGKEKFITTETYNNEMAGVIEYKVVDEWRYNMHSFIDHLIEGKDIDSFFQNLIK